MTTPLFDAGQMADLQRPKVEGALPMNVWLVQQVRSREQRLEYSASDQYHSQKMPPELARRMLLHAKPDKGWHVHDPFTGSGTTAIEWHKMGGTWFSGSEIEKDYAQLARKSLDEIGAASMIVRLGDCRACPLNDECVDLIVTSPPFAESDPNRDSADRTLGSRGLDMKNSSHGKEIPFTTGSIALLKCMGSRHLANSYERAMYDSFVEIRRVIKPGAFVLIAIRECWSDRGMEDLPGVCAAMAKDAGLLPYDKIFAVEAGMDEYGRLTSRASMHRHRLANQMSDRPCGRGVPAVTTVLVLQRRPRPTTTIVEGSSDALRHAPVDECPFVPGKFLQRAGA